MIKTLIMLCHCLSELFKILIFKGNTKFVSNIASSDVFASRPVENILAYWFC